MEKSIYLTECPRDAMQGLHQFIPTDVKINYINQLLKVGFDTLDFGSFVSPKAIPQLADTAQVLEKLQWKNSNTKLLAIIANIRGAQQAVDFEAIHFLGFPLSVSEQFQQRNTNKSIAEALQEVQHIQNLCVENGKEMVVYLSMAFGNPYNESYSAQKVVDLAKTLEQMGIQQIALADTIGSSNPASIHDLFTTFAKELPSIEPIAHLHSTKEKTSEKIKAAYEANCRRFDTAIMGYGGCPMATDELTGNVATEQLLLFLNSQEIQSKLNMDAFVQAQLMAAQVFN